jgi:1-acyl-sn-glycerol-3-phosphate acyltransferase
MMGGMRVVGKENVPMTGAVILAPIHLSYVDPPLVACACPRAISFMSREEFFGFPYGVLLRSLNAFPLRRGESDAGAVKLALSLMDEKRCLLMFPEGTRGYGEQLGPLMSGISMLAKRSGAQIVPVGMAGPEKMWPRGTKRIRRARLTVVFGKPFTYEEVAGGADKRAGRDQFSRVLAQRMVDAAAEAGLVLKTGF